MQLQGERDSGKNNANSFPCKFDTYLCAVWIPSTWMCEKCVKATKFSVNNVL